MRWVVVLLFALFALAWASSPSEKRWEEWLWQVAKRTYGLPYRYGGEDPRTGMDCSAFVRWVYARAGIFLPRTSREMYALLPKAREYRPGYLLFFSESGVRVDHVGIYIGRGYMLHSSGRWGQVVVEPVRSYGRLLVGIGNPFRR